jgi:hypothetical protein
MVAKWGDGSMKQTQSFFVGLFLLVGAINNLSAETIVFEDHSFISGVESFALPFMVTVPGTYKGTLTDFGNPAPFEKLGIAITFGGDTIKERGTPGNFFFTATSTGQYLANINAKAQSDQGVGLYHAQVALVPEADAWVMMILGISLIVFKLNRRNSWLPSFNSRALSALSPVARRGG